MEIGKTYTNQEISQEFKCSTQGGMRKSNRKNALILISNHIKSVYDDTWKENVLHYTGEGQEGDQTLTKQNKTLYESSHTDITVYLFEVYQEKRYLYQGEVVLVDTPYQTTEEDKNGDLRLVWKFPIQKKNGEEAPIIEQEILLEIEEIKRKRVRKTPTNKILERIKNHTARATKRKASVNQIERNPDVVEYTLRRAKGICDLCQQEAPFAKKDGTLYLEVHHVIRLAKEGPDHIYNTVALCPNCHRKMHVVDSKKDKKKLEQKIQEYLVKENMEEYQECCRRLFSEMS